MATTAKRKRHLTVKEMKFRNDPMVRLYDRTQDWLQEQGQPLVKLLGVVALAALVFFAGYYFMSYRQSKAADDYADAWVKYNAQVTDTPPTNGAKYYTDEKEKWQDVSQSFEAVAQRHSGYYGSMAKYLAGVAYLHFDKDKGLTLLQEVAARNEQPASDLAKMASAERYLIDGETDKATQLLEGLLNSPSVPKQVVELKLGSAYEKKEDLQRAADLYFDVAKADRTTAAGSEAEKRLSGLAPDRIKDLPPRNSTFPE